MASEHAIDIPDKTGPPHWKERCIYKVPKSIRKVNPKAYTPKLVSIGPIHHGKRKLKQMEQEKQRYSELFWTRVSISSPDAWKARYKDYLEVNEKNIRLCYSEEYPELSRDKFVDMILLDTVFIMELFLKKSERDKRQQDEYLFDKLWICKGIELDLLLIENQVPIFTLKDLYECYVPNKGEEYPTFFELAHKYFESYYPQKCSEETIDRTSSKHFTDFIRCFYIPKDLTLNNDADSFPVLLKTASELQKAGISFRAVHGKCLLDIKFESSFLNWFLCLGCFRCSECVKARLQLPQLQVDGTTERVLRNIIALEQCHYPWHTHVCSYISVLDYLINGKEDVELLVDKGVIVHRLGDNEEMASMINGLCKHVVIKSACNKKTIEDLNEHCESCWKRYMGIIKWVYFRDAWRCSATIVGVFVFILTVASCFSSFDLLHIGSNVHMYLWHVS